VALLGLAGPGESISAPGSGRPDLTALAKQLAAPSTREAAILALGEIADSAVEPLLRALKDDAVYQWKDGVAVLGDDGFLKDIAGQPILDASGQPVSPTSGEEGIALDERLFSMVQQILERLEVFSADAATRKSAAFKLGNS